MVVNISADTDSSPKSAPRRPHYSIDSTEYRKFRDSTGEQIIGAYKSQDEFVNSIKHLQGDKHQEALQLRNLTEKKEILDCLLNLVNNGNDLDGTLRKIKILLSQELPGKENLFDKYCTEVLSSIPEDIKNLDHKDEIFKRAFSESANRIINEDIQPKLTTLSSQADSGTIELIRKYAWNGFKIAAHWQGLKIGSQPLIAGYSRIKDSYTGATAVKKALNNLSKDALQSITKMSADDVLKYMKKSSIPDKFSNVYKAVENYSGNADDVIKFAGKALEKKSLTGFAASKSGTICRFLGMAPKANFLKTGLSAFSTGLKYFGFAGGPIGLVGGIAAGLLLDLVVSETIDAVSTYMSDEPKKQEGVIPVGEWIGSYCKTMFA
jgi:hypothetical protein